MRKRRARRNLNNMFDMWMGGSPKICMTQSVVVVLDSVVCV